MRRIISSLKVALTHKVISIMGILILLNFNLYSQPDALNLTEEEKTWVANNPIIKVGNERYWPPIDFLANDEAAGYSIDLMDLIAKEIGIKINYISGLSWSELLEALNNGTIDVLPAISKTDERETYIKFSESYIKLPYVKVLNSSISDTDINNLEGKSVAVFKGSNIENALKLNFPNINLVYLNSIEEALQNVSTGEVDVFIENLAVINYYLNESYFPNIKLNSNNLNFLSSSEVFIGVLEKNEILGNLIDKGLKAISQEEITRLKNKWLPIDSQNSEILKSEELLTEAERHWISNQDPLVVANEMNLAPFNFSENGIPKGYSIDIIQLIGDKTGLQLIFEDGNTWAEIISKFREQEIDILPYVYYTENRNSFMEFTESYESNPAVLVINSNDDSTKSLNDLASKQVAMVGGSTSELLKERFPNINQLLFDTPYEALEAVSTNRAQGFVASLGTVSYILNNNFIPNVTIHGNVNLKLDKETRIHIGVGKDRTILRNILQKGLTSITTDEKNEIRQKWLPISIATNAQNGFFSSTKLWKAIIGIALLFVLLYFVFKWAFNKGIKEKVALDFGSKKFRRKANFYLTILVFIVSGLGWLSLEYIEAEFSDNMELQLKNDLGSANGRLKFWLNERKELLKSLGRDRNIVAASSKLMELSNEFNQDQYSQTKINLNQIFDEYNYQASFIIDGSGVNIVAFDEHNDLGIVNDIIKNDPELLNKLFDGEVVFVPPILKEDNIETDQSSLMYFLTPIEDSERNIIAGIVQEIDPIFGFSEILQLSHVGESGESYIFNRKGRMLSNSRFEQDLKKLGIFQTGESEKPFIEIRDPGGNLTTGFKLNESFDNLPLTLMAQSAIRGEKSVNVEGYNDYRGVPVMGAWMWIDELELGLATEIDVEEAMSLFYFIRLLAIIVLAITLIFIIGSILFVLTLGEKANVALIRAKDELEERVLLRTTELNNEKSLLTSLIDAIPDLIFFKDTNLKFLGANKAFERQIGFEKEQFIGKSDKDFIPLELAEKFEKSDKKVLKELKALSMESKDVDPDGNQIIFDTKKNPFFNDAGELLGFIGVSRDITERKKTEVRLKSQSAALKSTANSVVITNDKGEIIWVNPALRKLTGYSWDELIGGNPKILNSGKHDESFFTEMWETISSGENWHGEIINKKKNGELYYEEMTITPVLNDKGKIIQYVAIKQDISERKEAEELIKASENKFRSIAATASDAIISANNKGIIESWNNAAETIFGYTKDEAVGQSLDIIVPEQYQNSHTKGVTRVASGGKQHVIGKTVELSGQHKDGHIFPVALSLSTWKENNVAKFSGIIRDISERKLYEKAIEDANKRMSGELNVAKDIQMSMLPLIFPAFPQREEIDIYANLIPAREVGGDFYDFHFLDENHIYFVVGDVSGKGVPAALMMAVTKTLLKSRAGNDKSTASILTHVNNEIAKDNDAYMFITVFIAILNTTTGEMVYSNAGHNPSFIIKEDREIVKLGDLHGPVIGAMEDMTYNETVVNIDKNDIVFAYTDGITEAQNVEEELYSDPRLIDHLKNGKYSDPKSLTKLIEDSVFEFQGEADQFDDITLLSLQYLDDKETTMSNSISISIKNQLNQMPKVIEAFEAFGEKNELSFGIIQKFNIALDELLNNIISYGFQDNLEHEINVEIELRHERLIFTLKDDGVPFNPFRNDPPDTMLSIDERNIGGLGIHLVKNLVDEYDYKRNTDMNIITLIKYNVNN